jgi:hypothetical protein
VVLLDKQVVSKHGTQKEAEEAATEEAQVSYKEGGLGQAVLHKTDGTIREERTYGKDPEGMRSGKPRLAGLAGTDRRFRGGAYEGNYTWVPTLISSMEPYRCLTNFRRQSP